MTISLNWLKEYIDPGTDPSQVAELLTGCGLEVESLTHYESVKGGLRGVVIGEVLTCTKHPNSDHLSLTTVNIGKEKALRIVCGAPNVATGQKVAVATVGTSLYFKDEEMMIRESKIRGELSEGMICAEDELGLGSSHEGIMVLDPAAVPGTPAREYFHVYEDTIFEIGLTPNRSDATSHIGVARDLAAVIRAKKGRSGIPAGLKLPDVSACKTGNHARTTEIIIEDTVACPRYTGVTMTGVSVKESPQWLKDRLSSIGQRPINNIVDITNFVLQEIGQPLHAFDADRIRGNKVIVRKLKKGTKFITLDEVERELTENDLMICDEKDPMVIGGVFGGIHSGVTDGTKNIFLESACFDPRTIRKTARYHGLQTDASFRFERGSDIGITVYALKRAALLIKEIAGGEISSEIIDIYPEPRTAGTVTLSFHHMDRLVGKRLDREEVENILTSLGLEVLERNENGLLLRIPSFKVDVTREADVIEEILRIYGYNNVEIPDKVHISVTHAPKPDPGNVQDLVSGYLCSSGFVEIMNNSLTRSSYYEGDSGFGLENAVKIVNPLSRDLDVLRQTLVFQGLETIVYNLNRKIADQKLFEFGTVYRLNAGSSGKFNQDLDKGKHGIEKDPLRKYEEEKHLSLWMTGRALSENWTNPSLKTGYFDLKGHIHNILLKTGIDFSGLTAGTIPAVSLVEGLEFDLNGICIVRSGRISPALLKKFDCRQEVFYADFNWDALFPFFPSQAAACCEMPKFPEVRRDLALLVDEGVTYKEIEAIAYNTENKLLKEVGLFDVYEGEKIEAGKKSYAVSFILQDERKTLTDTEIDKVMDKLIRAFGEKLKARIR